MNQRVLGWLWAGVVLLLAVSLSIQVYQGITLRTDITELLPGASQAPEIGVLTKIFRGNLGRTVVVSIDGPASENREAISAMVEDRFNESDVIDQFSVIGSRQRARSMYNFYFPKRYQFLASSVRKRLRSPDPVPRLADRIRRRLRGMSFAFDANIIERDPLLLYPGLVNQWINHLPGETNISGGGSSRTILARLSGNPFEITVHKGVNQLIKSIKEQVSGDRYTGSVSWTGVAKFAHQSRSRMLREMSLISTVSTVGILLLILVSFRNIRYLFQLLLSIGTGFLTAMTVCLWWFPDLHLVTVTFGASLIGVCVDYSFHYFVEADAGTEKPLWKVFPGITLGLVTTVIAYAFLSLTPFPALRQMALFSSLGLMGAFLTVVSWYSLIPSPHPGQRKRYYLRSLCEGILKLWRGIRTYRPVIVVLFLVTGTVIITGASGLTFTDDIRKLGNLSDDTLQMDRALRAETGFVDTGRYLLVQGESPRAVLRRESRLTDRLDRLKRDGSIGQYYGVSLFVPSKRRQRRDRELLDSLVTEHGDELTNRLGELGYADVVIERLVRSAKRPVQSFITVDSWLRDDVSAGFRSAWLGNWEEGVGSVVVLKNIQNEQRVRQLANDHEGVFYHNRVGTLQQLLREYRREAIGLIVISYVLISLVLMVRYGFLKGALSFLPAVTGGLVTVALLTFLGYSLHIMHVVSLLLILGMGVDYGIFLTEGQLANRDLTTIFTAVFLSAVSTILSFGLLALSDNPILHAIGITVFMGMVSMLFYAPMPVLLEDR